MTTAGARVNACHREISDPARLPQAPVVSVLMLAYNHGPYLAEAIDSVLMQQADFPFELLIGDDCSSDDTREIALRYQRAHASVIRAITADGNVGMHRNHRRLVDASRGQYLAYCEGDDYWNRADKLERQVEFLRSNPDHGAVHSEFTHIVHQGGGWKALTRFHQRYFGDILTGDVLQPLLVRNFIQTCTLVVRTGDVRNYFDAPLPVDSYKVADWPLCLFIAARSKIGYINEPLATYRKTPGSATNRGYSAEIERAKDSMRMASDYCRLLNLPIETERASHRCAIEHVLHVALRAGYRDEIRSALNWLAQNQPDAISPFRRSKYQRISSNRLTRTAHRLYLAWESRLATSRTYTEKPTPPCYSGRTQ